MGIARDAAKRDGERAFQFIPDRANKYVPYYDADRTVGEFYIL